MPQRSVTPSGGAFQQKQVPIPIRISHGRAVIAARSFLIPSHRSDCADISSYSRIVVATRRVCLSLELPIVPPRQGTHRAVRRACSSALTCGGEPGSAGDKHLLDERKE